MVIQVPILFVISKREIHAFGLFNDRGRSKVGAYLLATVTLVLPHPHLDSR